MKFCDVYKNCLLCRKEGEEGKEMRGSADSSPNNFNASRANWDNHSTENVGPKCNCAIVLQHTRSVRERRCNSIPVTNSIVFGSLFT
jgi:hypothetical protein